MSHGKWPRKSYAFTFTNWDLEFDYVKRFGVGDIKYIAYAQETCPKTKNVHHQGWMVFRAQKSTSSKNLGKLGGQWGNKHVHMEPVMGSLQDNDVYCSKEGQLVEHGKRPAQGVRADLEAVKDRINDGSASVESILMETPEFYHQYGRTLEKIQEVALRKKARSWMTKGVWLWGSTGVGKSHRAFKDWDPDTCYSKCLDDQWWDGYTGQEYVLLNEFRGQVTFSEMLDLCDKFPKTVKQRCKAPVPFLARKLVVTSCGPPEAVFRNVLTDQESVAQLRRRFQVIEITSKEQLVDL
jgi:hypothetical protein